VNAHTFAARVERRKHHPGLPGLRKLPSVKQRRPAQGGQRKKHLLHGDHGGYRIYETNVAKKTDANVNIFLQEIIISYIFARSTDSVKR
jgi:hypothetical protein